MTLKNRDDDFFEKWSNLPIKYAPSDLIQKEDAKFKSSTPQLLVTLSAVVVLIAIVTVFLLKLS